MNTNTPVMAQSRIRALPVIFAATLGFMVMVVAGHAQTQALHDAAHDMRHSAGFPCH